MADVNANINVDINTSNALAQLKALQREIARFHASVAKSSEAAALAQRDLQRNFLNGVNAIKGFSAELRTVKTTAENFTDSLERNKFSMREYFRYSMASTKTFGRFFRSELETVSKVAEENVKRLQTQYIKMGRDAQGAMRAIAVMPTELNYKDFATQTQMAAQRQAIFNQLVKQGSTNLLNFGKNTQWAGRQLMVGFTIPLIGLGSVATKTFMTMETAAIKFRKVYGDLFTPTAEREQALQDIENLGRAFTKYGIAVADTVGLAAEAAAAGFRGLDLQRQVTEATRLQVLGQIEQQKALETTISLQNAFRLSSADLAESINFLNAVENQTVVSLDDITTAIPKAAPIIRELGGDVKDLAFFMAAMKEGGINASEGANALKSGLASLINPSDKARAMLQGFGIDIDKIVEKNAGNVKQTIVEFAMELDNLSSLSRQRAIEQLFGKFQQARLSALFDNVIRDGNQASRVLDLAGTSTEELAQIAEQELGITANSSMNKFRKSVEDLKAALVPVGQLFLEIVTPFLENIGNILEKFDNLSAGTKKIIGTLVIGLGAIAPVVLMTVGLFANFVANGIKGLMLLRNGYLRLTGQSQILSEQTNFLSVQQQQALAAAASLEQSHMRLQQVFTGEATALRALISEYQRMIAAQNLAATRMPGMMAPGFKPTGYADGIVSVPGPKGAGDVIPAMVSPGEAIIPAALNKKYAPLVQGIIADNIPGFETGVTSVAERFISTRVGRSASGGERSQVNIPGGYQLGHFAEVIKVTGEELRRLAESQSKSFRDAVEAMIASVGGDVSRVFDVFTNEVAVQSKELNQALGEAGSGRLAPIELFKQEAVTQAGGYNAPLIREMKKAGASPEEIDIAVTRLSEEVQKGIDDLGGAITITAEEVNKITQDAYNIVSAENENVRVARERLRSPGALKEISGVTTGRTSFAGGYNTQQSKKEINAVVQEQIPGVYPTQQAFNFMGPAARKVGIQNAVAINEIYDQLSAEAKSRVLALLGDIDAMSQQVVLEAKNAGLDIGAYSIQGIAQGIEAASPSEKARRQGQNVVDGFEQGILEGMDDAALAASKVGDAAIQELNQPLGPGLPMGDVYDQFRSPNVPGGSVDNLTESFDDLSDKTDDVIASTSQSSANISKWNNRLMSTSFALSGLTGIASAFGQDFGGLGNIVFKVSSAMFALQAVIQTLTATKMLELAQSRLQIARGAAATAAELGMGRGGQLAMFSRALFTAINPLAKIALVVGAGVAIYKVINNRIEENRKKIDGLGDAALATGNKIKGIESFFGVDLKDFLFETIDTRQSVVQGLAGGQREQVEKFIDSDDFKAFRDDVQALRSATDKEARIVLEGLAIQLQSKGLAKDQISIVIDALKQEAGKRDVSIDFKSIDITTTEGKKELQNSITKIIDLYNKKFSKGINDAYRRNLGLTSKSIMGTIGALQLQFETGAISAADYVEQIKGINSAIINIPNSAAKINLVNGILETMGKKAQEAAAGISEISGRLLLIQALSVGAITTDDPLVKMLGSESWSERKLAETKILEKYNAIIKGITQSIADNTKTNSSGNTGDKKGLTLQERLIKIYQKQAKTLEEKLKLMQDVNDEIERNNEFTKQQVNLDKQITEAKMSGNYLEAAALLQQKTMEAAQFARETEEIDIQKQIDNINKRISQLEDNAKITSAERRLLDLEEKKTPPKPETTKTPPKPETTKTPPKPEVTSQDFQTPEVVPDPTKTKSGETIGPKKQNIEAKTLREAGKQAQTGKRTQTYIPVTGGAGFDIFTWRGRSYAVDKQTGVIYEFDSKRLKVGSKAKYAEGGLIKGPGTGTSDSILGWVDGYAQGGPIRVSNGEFIFSKKAVDNAGGPKAVGALHQRLRNAPAFKEGGMPGRRSYITNWNQEKIPVMPKGIAKPGTEYAIAPEKNYPTDNIKSPMGSLQRFIDIARSQIGSGHNYKIIDKEGTEWDVDANKYTTYVNDIYKLGSDVLYWCGAFIAWVAKNSGVNISNKMFSAFQASQDYKKKGMFNDLSQLENIKNLKIGDIAWFDFVKANTPGIPDHAAIVTGKSKDSVRAIGQYGMGTVAERSWKLNELFGSARPEGFAKGGLIKGFKGGGAPHEMGMRGAPKKQNWFQRYVSNLTKVQDQAASILGIGDALGLGSVLRKIAGQGRKGDTLSAALLPLNFMGFGLGRGVASGVKGGVSVAGKVLAGSKKAIDSIYKTQKVEHEGIKYLTYQLAEGGPRFAFQGMGEDLSGLLAAGKIDEIIPTTPQGLLESALKMNPKNKKAQALLESIKNKTYRGNNAETAEYNDFLDSMLGAVSINAKGNAGRIEDSSGFALVMAALNGNEQAAQIVAAKKDAFRKIIADRIAQQKKKIMEGKDAEIAAGKYATGKGDPSKISIFHSRSADRPFEIDKDGNVSIYTYGEMNADNPLGSQARSTLHFTAINPVKGITERAEDASNIKLVTRLDKAIDQVGNPQNLYDQDTWWSLSPGEPFKIKKGDYTIIKPFKTFEEYLKEVTKRGLIKDKSKSVWDIPDVLFDPKTYEVLHSPGKDEYEGMNIASKANKIAQEALGLKTSLSSHGPDIPSEQSLLDELERIAYDLQIEQGLHSLTGSDQLEQLFYMETGLHHSKVGYADPFAKFTYASNKAASGWSDTLEAVREQARRGNFHTNQIDTRKVRSKYLAFANGGYINMASLPKFKNGIDRVPYDMPAFLHKDERVLTAEENKRYGTSNITLSPTFNITGGNSDEIVNKVMVKLTNLANKNNKGNKVVF